MTVFMLQTNSSDMATTILRECDDKTAIAAQADPRFADARIIERKALGTLTGGELVAIYNSLMSKADQINKFADKDSAVRRVLAAWDADKATPDAPPGVEPVSIPKVEAPKAKVKGTGRPRKVFDGTLHVVVANTTNKRWNEGSLRSKVFAEIEAAAPVAMTDFLPACAKKLKVTEARVRACIVKIVGVHCVRVQK